MNRNAHFRRLMLASFVGLLSAGAAIASTHRVANPEPDQQRQVAVEKSGSLVTKPGLTLRLMLDRGDVVIQTQDTERVDYRLKVETPAGTHLLPGQGEAFVVFGRNLPTGTIVHAMDRDPILLHAGNVWVTLDVTVPKDYNVEVSTLGGTIRTSDLRGQVVLTTGGGNIYTGNIHGSARLATSGGHIAVKDVSGDLFAQTGGGHICAGKIGGEAMLHTAGGHIHAVSVTKNARLETGGGNISLGRSGTEIFADTAGGQIELGEMKGAIRAQTGGGGIRVASAKGPVQLQAGSGSIYLTRVDKAVHAQTGAGAITAWLDADTRIKKPCILESGQGDIVVYVSPDLPLTIDAAVQTGDTQRIYVDPALPVKVTMASGPNGTQQVRAEGALNGGGEVLRLRTVDGNIRLLLNDASREAELYKQQMEEIEKQVEKQLQAAQSANLNQP